jgi:hypothetical protein
VVYLEYPATTTMMMMAGHQATTRGRGATSAMQVKGCYIQLLPFKALVFVFA